MIEESTGSPWAGILGLIEAGGPVVVILLFMSVIALAVLLLKLWQFRSCSIGDRRTARDAISLYRAGRPDEALSCAAKSKNPAAQVLAHAIRGQRRPDLEEATVREEVVRFGSDLLHDLRAYFRPLEVIASLAPLLGLFGTVLGMIAAFRQMEAAGSQVDPSILSGGIWEALLTTAVGLAVAIPVIAVLNWLESRVDRLAHEMNSVATQIFTHDLAANIEPDKRHEPRFTPAAVHVGR